VAFMPRHIDLTGLAAAPPELRIPISISAEDWDGSPNERRALLQELAAAGNVLVLSGDLHCFFAGTPFIAGDEASRVVELVTGSVSSATWLDTIQGTLTEAGSITPEVSLLVQNVGLLLADQKNRPNPHLAYQSLGDNGFSLVEVGADEVQMSVFRIPAKLVATPPSKLKGKLDDLFTVDRFRMPNGAAELEQEIDGKFLTWSRQELDFQ